MSECLLAGMFLGNLLYAFLLFALVCRLRRLMNEVAQ